MKYGAQNDDRLEYPPDKPIKWIGVDTRCFIHKEYIVESKTWFEARHQIAILAKPDSVNTLEVKPYKE